MVSSGELSMRFGKRSLRDRADAARDSGNFHKAALLYEEHLLDAPDDAAIHIQCGHMHKESGDLVSAEQHYNRAKELGMSVKTRVEGETMFVKFVKK